MDMYVRRFHEKVLDYEDSMEKEIYVNISLHSMVKNTKYS